ncbi:flagellar hook protein FlgE [Enterovirga sp.]|jgi:flagellar hook protein FlgE|uniref:flagellar hook protein FlgE n=1 Tax=Enterovirga sp. TaxID=2026350 RepID=UPI00260FCD62|nr:flagellar hook-basal body complex protein [Enterovirga sp.]MDB5592730.1 flagellar hook-basal body complex protein [Enterovirga sp.]
MGILNALSTAVTGLSAQSYALENISGNIANSQTVGFKRVDTSFVDLIPDAPARHESAGSVGTFSQLTNTLQGSLKSTGITTNMALNGDGYFTVQSNTGSNSQPVFSGQNLFTRRGDFQSDANGYLVNGSGNYLMGSVSGQGSAPIKLPTTPLPAKQTGGVTYQANLPLYPKTARADAAVAGSELLDAGLAGGATVSGADRAAFLGQTIAGGDVTVYDGAGTAVTMQTRWGKTASSAAGGTDTWNLYYQVSPTATGSAAAWAKVGAATFTPSGALTSASSMTIPSLAINGTTVGPVSVKFGSGNLTQYGDAGGEMSNGNIQQDGYSTGTLNGVSVSSDGRVTGSYSNGQISTIAQVLVAHFNANDLLKRMDGGSYAQTAESGAPSFGLQGSSLTGGSVEMSNTDISDEFSKMIVTQQAYSANTRVMSTAQQMLQDVINVIR